MRTILIAAVSMLMFVPTPSYGQKGRGGVGIRASIGTDIELGLGFGGGVSYLWAPYVIRPQVITFANQQ